MKIYLYCLTFLGTIISAQNLNAYPVKNEQKNTITDSSFQVDYSSFQDIKLIEFLLNNKNNRTSEFYEKVQDLAKDMNDGWLKLVLDVQKATTTDIKTSNKLLQEPCILPKSIKDILPEKLANDCISFTSALLIYLIGFIDSDNENSNLGQQFDDYVNSCIDNSVF